MAYELDIIIISKKIVSSNVPS